MRGKARPRTTTTKKFWSQEKSKRRSRPFPRSSFAARAEPKRRERAIVMEYDAAVYDAASTARYEQSVQQQLQSRSYDLGNNKALLKNYMVHSAAIKHDLVRNVLVLALMRLPSSDFTVLVNLLPPKCLGQKQISFIMECAALLERGRYADFWEHYVSRNDLFSQALGFVENIRLFVLGNLRDTFKAMPKTLFMQQLGLDAAAVDTFCNGNMFIEKVSADDIHFAASEENTKHANFVPPTTLRTTEVSRTIADTAESTCHSAAAPHCTVP